MSRERERGAIRAAAALGAALAAGAVLLAASPAAAAIRFREVAEEWGVDFRHRHGGWGEFFMIETMGSGLAAFDYDGDGDVDLFFVDSGELPPEAGEPPAGASPGAGSGVSRSRLFRNDGAGRFVDVTAGSGLEVDGYGMGAAVGDVDGDGDPDLYVTAYGANQLFENRGDGTFRDATAAAGVGDELWGASAAFGDPDRDGDLDLYVTDYVTFAFDDNPLCGKPRLKLRSYCHPDVYDGQPDRYFVNRGDGTFTEASAAAGIAPAAGKGLGVVVSDLDADGWPDLYVANDMTPNFLFVNRGDGRFDERALLSGTALSDRGEPEAGMGVDAADVDGDGRPDLVVTHLDLQTNALYGNLGAGVFADRRFESRLAEPSVYKVGFGAAFADLDRDGDLDLAVANGHIIHNVDQHGTGTTYRQANQVFANRGDGVFTEVEEAGLVGVRASRGLAAADLDGDGDVDLAISSSDDRAEVYENVTAGAGRWLAVELAAAPGAGHSVGARIEAEAGGRAVERELRGGGSYMSAVDAPVLLGLGGARRVERLAVTWLDGRRVEVRDLPVDRGLRLERREAWREVR